MKLQATFYSVLAAFALQAQQAPALLPFRARLTAADGTALTNGIRLVEVKVYDQPAGGRPVWPGELHHTSINGGLVNLLLGTKTPLTGVDFNKTLYIEVTVDANADDRISFEDSPILPRQILLPSVFAHASDTSRNTQKLQGADWSAILVSGADPRDAKSFINTAKFPSNSLAGNLIGPGAISNGNVAAGAVIDSLLAPGSVGLTALKNEILAQLAPPGIIVPFAGQPSAVPPGWLPCDGHMVAVSDYPALYSVIGINWGEPDRSGMYFYLPDFRGRFERGVSDGTNRDPDAAARFNDDYRLYGNSGDTVASLEGSEFESHNHSVYSVNGGNILGVFVTGSNNPGWDNPTGGIWTAFDTLNIELDQDNGGVETRPINADVIFMIKY